MKRPVTRDEAVARLEELCVRGEQCTCDLRRKLFQWGVPGPYDDLIDGLVDRKFVDDSRFARAYVRDKYRFDRWGRLKIVRGLMAKRIDRSVILEALEEIDVREYAGNCYKLLDAKRRQLPPEMEAYERRRKLLHFAAGRGYEMGLIIKLLDNPRLWPD